jgi:hypothetical protein
MDQCDGEMKTINIQDLTRDKFFEEAGKALQARRNLCPFEHEQVVEVMKKQEISGGAFGPNDRYPVFGSYDLLAATVLSHHLHPEARGYWLEFGVFKGSSINITAHISAQRNASMSVHGFDTFFGLPQEWSGHMSKGTFSLQGILPRVVPDVTLHKGLFSDTLRQFIRANKCNDEIGLIGTNIDCDLYGGTYFVLQYLSKRCIRSDTILHFHDFYSNDPKLNPMEELKAMYDWMTSFEVILYLLPVRSLSVEATVFIVQSII